MKQCIVLAAALAVSGTSVSPGSAQTAPAKITAASSVTSSVPDALQLRALPAVLDVRERRLEWHVAAKQAADRIQDPALKDQFNQRLSGLVPIVAKSLIAAPQEDALVTVAVYRDAANRGKQAMVAVTFDGLGADVGPTFYADVIAGLPKPPEADGIPKSLTLDTEATSYMVFFLGKNELSAGDISQTVMGRSVVAATNRDREHGETGIANAQIAAARVPASKTPPQPQTDAAHPETGDPVQDNQYIIPQGYGPGNDGYYYPSGIGVPIVILPGETGTSPELLNRQRRRQMDLEKRYQRNPNSINPTAQSTTAPPSAQSPSVNHSVTNPPANYVAPQPARKPSNPPASPPAGAPGGPPPAAGGKSAPPAGSPPAGAPGGPPAGKK